VGDFFYRDTEETGNVQNLSEIKYLTVKQYDGPNQAQGKIIADATWNGTVGGRH